MKKADAAEETARAAMAMRAAQVNLTPGSKLHALVEGRDSPDSEPFLRLIFRTNQGSPPLALSPKVDLQAERSRMEEAARISMRRRFSSLVATTTIGLLPATPEPPPSPLPPPDDGRPKISKAVLLQKLHKLEELHAMPSDLSQNRLRRTYTSVGIANTVGDHERVVDEDTFVAIVETLRHEDETKSKKVARFRVQGQFKTIGK